MKKKFLCLFLALLTAFTACSVLSFSAFSEEEASGYVQDGLFAWYKGDQNTRDGQDTDSNTWHDLIGGYDFPVTRDDANYFTDEGFRVNGKKHYFPDEVLNLVNESCFTIEIEFGDFDPYGQGFNVFMNSTNDYFSLFRRVSENVIEWKYGGGNNRPKIRRSLDFLGNHLLTFTCEYGGVMVMYVDGVEMERTTCDLYMGADDLFIGQTTESRSYDALYKNIRFYSRPLAADEVEQNARAMGYDPEQIVAPKTHISIAQPVTNIVGDVALVRPINSRNEFEAMMAADALPAVAVYEIDIQLRTLDASGAPFSTVEAVMEDSQYQTLPCFSMQDRATADALASYLKQIDFFDVQIMSADKSVLTYARTLLPQCYGVLDLREELATVTDLSEEQLLDIRRAVKVNNAYIAVLPATLCRNEDVQYLYNRQVNVWAWGSDTPNEAEQYFALLSGAVGVVSDATDSYLDIACNRLARNTVTRASANTGHGGLQSRAPENTLEGSILAYELGANVIEMDVHLTADGHVVAMHDSTTSTCDQNLNIETSTLAQLKKLYVNKRFENHETYSSCRIPTLDEYLEWFQDKDCLFFIEIKSSNPDIVSVIKNIVDKYGMYGQCSVITFHESIMEAMREEYPEMSVGCLGNGLMDGADADRDMPAVMSFVGQYNGTHNPYYAGYDAADLRACLLRGVSIYPWTIAPDEIDDYYRYGYGGLTNDYADYLGDTAYSIELSENPQLQLNTASQLSHTVSYYDHTEDSQPVSKILLLEGSATLQGTTITPTEVGELTFLTAHSYKVMGNMSFVMYTQPVTVTVIDPDAETETETETEAASETVTAPTTDGEKATEPADTADTDGEVTPETERTDHDSLGQTTAENPHISETPSEKGCHSAVSGAVCILSVLAAAIVCVTTARRRRS